MKKHEVIEDNGGGLTLAVFSQDGKVEYIHTGYEYVEGQLRADLEALKSGDNPVEDWDGNEEDPQSFYDDFLSYEYGWEVVADNDRIYPDRMGGAARKEFQIPEE